MRLLLDTHAFLWWADDDTALSATARDAIANRRNDCYFSIASCWELAIKSSIGKLRLAQSVDRFVMEQLTENGFKLLPIDFRHVTKVENLPFHHRDPFDRLLIAQAMVQGTKIVTADPVFCDYGVQVIW